jgi:2-C-methyl-D-erythritol 4-phosphate cytidylyltransferase
MVTAIIVAAGSGTRLGGEVPKQYLDLCGKPLFCHSLHVFDSAPWVDRLVLVVPPGDMDTPVRAILREHPVRKPLELAPGGASRQGSVFNGLLSCDPRTGIVFIHDAARPFITPAETLRCVEAARVHGAAVLAHPASDTIKKADDSAMVVSTLDRSTLWQIGTPQAFSFPLILSAHKKALSEGFSGTDDAALVERLGHPVLLVSGSRWNFKITGPEDLMVARAVMEHGKGR